MKTPLKIETQESPFGDCCSTFDAAGFLICDNEAYYPHPVAPEHQERIVACVNACQDMADPEVEIATLRSLDKELANALRMTVSDPDALDGRPRTWEVVQEVLAKLPAPGQAWSEFFTGANP